MAQTAKPQVCTVGHAAVDHCFDIDQFPPRPTKTPARAYRVISGGMAANASIAAVRLGAEVRLHGAIGDDEAGDFLVHRLEKCGVQCRYLQRVPDAGSSISAVVIDAHGERQIYNSRGEALLRAAPLDVTGLTGCDVLMVDPRWMAGALAALRWARGAGVLSVMDGDISPQADLRALAALADWAVFSESGLAAFTPGLSVPAALQAALDAGAQVAAVTLGAHGVKWMRRGTQQGGVQSLAAFEVQAMDTNGAGDVFHASLAIAITQGRTDRDAMRFASAAAALKCQRSGGVARGPDLQEVERFLRERS